MEKRNGGTLILVLLLIILFTEIVGINMQIGLNYLPIFFAIITIILFNFKLKEQAINGKNMVIINISIIVLNYLLMQITDIAFSCIYITCFNFL